MTQKESNYKVGRIMVVDDEVELMTAICEMLAGQGYEASGFRTGAEALEILRNQEFDLLLTDLMMPGMDGIEVIRASLEIDSNLIAIIMTGHGTVQTAVEAMKIGAFDYILKPFKLNTLMPLLTRAMQMRNLRTENMQLKETVAIHELGKAIAFSSDFNSIMNKVADAALQQCSADEVSIMLPTRDGRELYVAVVRGGHVENIGSHSPIDQGIAGWVACNREPVVLRGEVNDQRMAPIKPRSDIHTAVSMPMLSAGNLVGVLNVNITRSHRHFTLGQVKVLSILVSIIAPILEKTSLYIQIREAEEKYRSIFENALEGIYQQSPEGRLLSANPALARILGYDSPEDLMTGITDVRQVYADSDRASEFVRLMDTQGEARNFEYRARRKDGSLVWVSVNGRTVPDGKGGILHYEGILTDITERKVAESRLKLTREILETLNRTNEILKLIEDIFALLKEHMDIEAVGIRLREGEDYPYFVTNGFPAHLLEAETHICAYDDAGEIIRDAKGNPYLEGRCGNVLSGRTDPSRPYFTEGGSFWTNSTTKYLVEKAEKECQGQIRNHCNSEGYESLALIPLRSGEEIIGLLHLSDTRQNLFTPDTIHFFEGIGASIGIAIARKRSVEAVRESEEKYRLHFENVTDVIYSSDPNLTLLNISPSIERMLGYKPADLIGRPIRELNIFAPDCLEKVCLDIQRVLAGEKIDSNIYEFIAKDGIRRHAEVNSAHLTREGNSVGVISVARDVTERRQAEEWLLRERSMVDRIMKTSPAGITVVNRNGKIVFANKRAEEILGLTADKLICLTYDDSKLRIADFDGNPFPHENLPFVQVISSGNSIYGIRHAITSPDGRRIFLSINSAPIFDDQGSISEVISIIDDVSLQKHAEDKITKGLEQLFQSFEGTVKAMAMTIEARDPYTAGHQRRVSDLAEAIAIEMGLTADQITGIRVGSMTHDIGKISVPAEILNRSAKLTEIEFSLIKTHSQSGYDILKDIAFPWPITRMILEHHERMNGSGYPNGLTGDNLLMESRILSVADVVEAMASHRPYRPSLGLDAALDEITKNKGVLYDPEVVDACLRLFMEKGYKIADGRR